MPTFDSKCLSCDWKHERLEKSGENPPCPVCGSPTEHYWVGKPSGIQTDEGFIGGLTLENVADTPQTFYSRGELKRYLHEHGLQPRVRHVGLQGSDKSPHTVRHDSAPPAYLTEADEDERLRVWWEHEHRLQAETHNPLGVS